MRGKLMFRVPRRARVGITPAHAGKTSTKCFTTSACRDHPRACGENSFQLCKHLQQPGSPPRMRGKQAVKLRDVRHAGITPAHAGKTCSVTPLRCGERDHPRACGENFQRAESEKARLGSPPRMRGKQFSNPSCPLHPGITPAHAGKTKMY